MTTWIEPGEAMAFAFAHHAVPLRTLISRQDRPIDKSKSALADLKLIAKITFGGELVLRNEEEKRGYKGPLFEARPDELIISKIRVDQGSFCVVPAIGPIAVSPEYPVYALNKDRIRPDFLARVLRTPSFTRALTQAKSGNTTKQRIRPAFFESQAVPLPSLDRQREIMAAHDALIAQAAALDAQAEQAEADALADFEKALGYGPQPPLPDRPIFIAQFRELDRWSHDAILRGRTPSDHNDRTFPAVALADLGEIVYGLQKHPGNRPGEKARPYLRVANVQRGLISTAEMKTIDVSEPDFARLRLRYGDLLFVEGNGSRENLGRVAVWREEVPDCIHQNHLIRARLDPTRVMPEFAAAWFNSHAGRRHFFEEGKTTSGLGTINSAVVRAAPIPLPPLTEQKTMIAALDAARAEAASLRAEAAALRDRAARDFEEAVYGPADAEAVAAPGAA